MAKRQDRNRRPKQETTSHCVKNRSPSSTASGSSHLRSLSSQRPTYLVAYQVRPDLSGIDTWFLEQSASGNASQLDIATCRTISFKKAESSQFSLAVNATLQRERLIEAKEGWEKTIRVEVEERIKNHNRKDTRDYDLKMGPSIRLFREDASGGSPGELSEVEAEGRADSPTLPLGEKRTVNLVGEMKKLSLQS